MRPHSRPLLSKCQVEGGGIHIVGDSSTGKTTILEAARSVWGGEYYKRSWRATANGIEGAAALFNDSILIVDEVSECEPHEVGAIVYALGNGFGKQRASRTGAAREVLRWRCFVLSSGERSIETAMLGCGYRAKAGQEVRMLTVPAAGQYGAFDDLKGCANGAILSDSIKKAAALHYGHAGSAFLHKLTHDDRDFFQMVEASKELFGETDQLSGQEKRALNRFLLVAAAGELATEYGITGWKRFEASEAARTYFQRWLEDRKGGNDEIHQMKSALLDYIDRYGDGRFTELNCADERGRIPERSGYWRVEAGERQYLFTSDGMQQVLRGFDFKPALRKLSAAGVLPSPGAGGAIAQRITVAPGRRVRLYPVTLEIEK